MSIRDENLNEPSEKHKAYSIKANFQRTVLYFAYSTFRCFRSFDYSGN